MSMILNYEKLWEPYSKDGNTLENSIRYLKKLATQLGISTLTVDLAVQQIMLEVSEGKIFPLDKCPCGCGIDKAGTAITHAMSDRMINIDKKAHNEYVKCLNDISNNAIINHIEKENKNILDEYNINENLTKWQKVKKWIGLQ